MKSKDQIQIIIAKFNFFSKYYRIIRLLVIIVYLIYLEMLIVNVFSAVDYVPTIAEIRTKFIPITTKNEAINSIEQYLRDREKSLSINLQKDIKNNPFIPYDQKNSESNEDTGVSGNSDSINNIPVNVIN